MYHYIEDKHFLKQMRRDCSDIVNQLVQSINNDDMLSVEMELVGSGARNLITQNGDQPIDLDYNLCIEDFSELQIGDGRKIKDYVKERFDAVLVRNGWGISEDSTSALSTEWRHYKTGNRTEFKMDLGIVRKSHFGVQRLIHLKTGFVQKDEWYWNTVRGTIGFAEKVQAIKDHALWQVVRDRYLEKKNMYLTRNDNNHPSFIVYLETVHEIYHAYIEAPRRQNSGLTTGWVDVNKMPQRQYLQIPGWVKA
ncbi:MAG: hypothetical protein E7604_07725 [Ruminococcaceae bacterium]|nr:hypothetical protein [Oscillospiraceae bacterium]